MVFYDLSMMNLRKKGFKWIKNMLTAKQSGAPILPAMPGFYHKPKKLDDLVDFIVGKILDQLDIAHALFKKWKKNKNFIVFF